MTTISSNIKTRLQSRLNSVRSKVRTQDIYLDEEHALMCSYYEKYLELSKKFESIKRTIHIPYKKIVYGSNDEYMFEDSIMKIEYFWNDYNKKFINNLYIAHSNDKGYDEEWIEAQNNFITSLSVEELHTLRSHTCDGDVIANYFLQKGSIDKDIDSIGGDNRKEDTIFIRKKRSKTERDFILFYYQIIEYIKQDISNMKSKIDIEQYIKENYHNFDWNKIIRMYIKDVGKIFKKCPKVKNEFVVYRGVEDEYHLSKSYKGKFPSSTLTSVTLDSKVAITYAGIRCCVQRIRLCKGAKAILIEGISMYDNDKEVLLPFNTTYNIEYPRHEIKIYKTGTICPSKDTKTMIVSDLYVA